MASKGQKFNKYSNKLKNIIFQKKQYQIGNKNYGILKNIQIKDKSVVDLKKII